MILLDTHIWVWWVDDSDRLAARERQFLDASRAEGLGVSIISCWEVAKLVEYHRLHVACPVEEWMAGALAIPSLQLVGLTPQIVIVSTQLPPPFHRDPADQVLVAPARVYDLALLTVDDKLLQYAHVRTL